MIVDILTLLYYTILLFDILANGVYYIISNYNVLQKNETGPRFWYMIIDHVHV